MHDFKSFLEHEQQVIANNIDRLKRGLAWYKEDDSMAQGHLRMLAVQERHLAMVGTLMQAGTDPNRALAICHETLRLAEAEHKQLIQQERSNSDTWWETLDVIQFVSALIYRIEDWKSRYQPQH